jgi:LPXTG-motif cell wall-anchored protein
MGNGVDMQDLPEAWEYPSSYGSNDQDIFGSDGMAGFGMGATDDGYVGNATVTTNDPAPAGDLKVHSAPNASAPQIGGADKGAVVEVVTEPGLPPGWGKVGTFASARNAAVVGYASLAYLTPIAGTGRDIPQPAVVVPGTPVVPVVPVVPGQPVAPGAPAAADDSTFYVALGAGALLLGAAAYFLLRKKKSG